MRNVAEVQFSNSSLGAFLRATRVGVMERLLFDRILLFCKSRGKILYFSVSVEYRMVFASILRLLDCMDVNVVLEFAAIACLREGNRSPLGVQSWFSYKFDNEMFITHLNNPRLRSVLPNGTDRKEVGDDVCPIYCKEYELQDKTIR